MDQLQVSELLDRQDEKGLSKILGNVLSWRVHPSQSETVTRQVTALRYFSKLENSPEQVDLEEVRSFLRECSTSRPHRSLKWAGIVA